MLDLGVDAERLSALVSEALGRRCRLEPQYVRCTYPVFRGETADGRPVFVKVGTREEWTRTAGLLRDVGACAFLPRLLVDAPLDYDGHAVFVMEWREAEIVFPEDMSEAQADSFAAGCRELSRHLQATHAFTPVVGSPLDPDRLFAVVKDYARRHPLAGRLLGSLTEVPQERRTFGTRPLAVLHGDFHAKNFGFVGETFARVIDFDQLTQGLPCGDLANALVERYSCLHLSAAARRRLDERTRRIVAASSWPREDFEISCNVLRLRFAVRRLEKHPDSAWVALDILRRDRKIRGFLKAI